MCVMREKEKTIWHLVMGYYNNLKKIFLFDEIVFNIPHKSNKLKKKSFYAVNKIIYEGWNCLGEIRHGNALSAITIALSITKWSICELSRKVAGSFAKRTFFKLIRCKSSNMSRRNGMFLDWPTMTDLKKKSKYHRERNCIIVIFLGNKSLNFVESGSMVT